MTSSTDWMPISRTGKLVPALALLLGCGGEQVAEEPILRPVRYTQVFASGGERTRTFSGASQPAAETPLSFRVAGTVADVNVSLGDRVREGQVVAALDPSDYQLQLQEAQATLRRLESEARNADAAYGRVRALYENNNASRADLDAARTAFESATAGVQQTETRIELLQRQVEYTTLEAPRSGGVTAVDLEVGQNVGQGQTVLRLASGTALQVEVGIPEVLISDISVGDPVTVSFSLAGAEDIPGRITEVGLAADVTSTFPVTVELTENRSDLRPGMAAEVSFQFSGSSDSRGFVLPTSAVGEDADGRFVIVLDPAGDGTATASRRAVTIGELTSGGVQVLTGVADGEYVATAGLSLIRDGMRLRMGSGDSE